MTSPSRLDQSYTERAQDGPSPGLPSSLPAPPSEHRPELVRPLEPSNVQAGPMPYLPPTSHLTQHDQTRRPPTRVQDLLIPGPSRPEPAAQGRWPSIGSSTEWRHAAPAAPNPSTHHASSSSAWPYPPPPPASANHRYSLPIDRIDSQPQRSYNFSLPPPRTTTGQHGPSTYPMQTHRMQSLSYAEPPMAGRSSGAYSESAMPDQRRDSARPGKGLCYVYRDGATVPTEIDGENVNPLWGRTKAGKARKRLAQACLNCREKKIRCDPRQPKCKQCEKAKRNCIMPPAPQAQSDNTGTVGQRSARPSLSPPAVAASRLELPGCTLNNVEGPPQKRRRSTEDTSSLLVGDQSAIRDPTASQLQPERNETRPQSFSLRNRPESKHDDNGWAGFLQSEIVARHPRDQLMIDSEADPYLVNPTETLQLLDHFFAQQISTYHYVYPRGCFMKWVRNCTNKTAHERMVLYSILALGSVNGDEISPFGQLCAKIASFMTSKWGDFSPLIIQSRLFLMSYNMAHEGHTRMTIEYGTAAMTAAVGAHFYSEEGCARETDPSQERNAFGLTTQQLIECKRRTFWSCFIVDRLVAFCESNFSIPRSENIRLRLPCSDKDYEDGLPSSAPFFDNGSLDRALTTTPIQQSINPRAVIMQVAQSVADAAAFVQTSMDGSVDTYADEYESFCAKLLTRLAHWKERLPESIQYNSANLRSRTEDGTAGPFLWAHTLYHVSHLAIYRQVRHSLLPVATVQHNVRAAHHHALKILGMVQETSALTHNAPRGFSLLQLVTSSIGYAIWLALNVVTANGAFTDSMATRTKVYCGHDVLQAMSHIWRSAKQQQEQVHKRIDNVHKLTSNMNKMDLGYFKSAAQPVRMEPDALERINLDCDIIYGISTTSYFDALRSNDR